ncbi:MAG TPA: ATP-binding protein [Melioribacteraceae bacterium]|nr:ATP-binding protein [Melioribacteraceae bacterium]
MVFNNSLKTKIITSIGLLIIFLMLLISVLLLVQWRENILQKEIKTAEAITSTFAVTLTDAMIFEGNSVFIKENILESYIDNFINKIDGVVFVTIYDEYGSVIINRYLHKGIIKTEANISFIKYQPDIDFVKIYNSKKFGWLIEANQNFKSFGHRWGYLKIGFSAKPVLSELTFLFFMLLIATIVVSGFVILLLNILVKKITSRLDTFVNLIENINYASEYNIAAIDTPDEIDVLYKKFDEMQKRINQTVKQLENANKQIYQAEKLASIGRLASGVAHQVNNPLNGIKSCLYAIKTDPENKELLFQYLDLINEGIENIETVVNKLLGFARQQPISDNIININYAIQKVTGLFDYRLKAKNIEVIINLKHDIPKVKIEYHLFQEVIMNLLLNAADSIANEGKITIHTYSLDNNVCMEIADTGCGIVKNHLPKIFEPFFTTKDMGIGTGLGLSVCQGIIESHGGKITVSSTINKGTTFIVFLPINYDETINN